MKASVASLRAIVAVFDPIHFEHTITNNVTLTQGARSVSAPAPAMLGGLPVEDRNPFRHPLPIDGAGAPSAGGYGI